MKVLVTIGKKTLPKKEKVESSLGGITKINPEKSQGGQGSNDTKKK